MREILAQTKVLSSSKRLERGIKAMIFGMTKSSKTKWNNDIQME